MHARANARIRRLNEYVRRYECKSKDFVFFFFFSSNENEQWTRFNERLDVVLNCRRCTRCRWTFEHSKTRIWNCDDRSFGGARIPFLSFTHTLSLSLSLARSLALFLSLSFFLSNFLHHQTIDFAVFVDFRRKTRVERMRNTVMVMRKDRNHREVKRYGTVPESHFKFSHEWRCINVRDRKR